jgi:protein arginine kinase
MDSSLFVQSTVTSTRIRFARNLKGCFFPTKLNKAQAQAIIDEVEKALANIDTFTRHDISSIGEKQATLLQEKYLISPELIRKKDISSAFISSDKEVSIMVNEEDHLREQYILKGYDLYKAYERLSGIDDMLDKALSFAYDDKMGYLTACPSNLGTGLRASVMMFLPGLAWCKKLVELLPSLRKNGLTVRGGFGEGTAAKGWAYQISNERTLGFTEEEILSHMNEVTLNLTEMELVARERMLEKDELLYKDICLRAYGKLCNCAVLPIEELTEDIVKVRLGVALGFFEASSINAFNDFISNMRPVSFQMGNCPDATKEETDILRAKIVNKVLPRLVKRHYR